MSAERMGTSARADADIPKPSLTDPDEISVELSSRRTGMSFQRTRMSADRTLMSVIRTALSLISFGFTIYQVFGELHRTGAFPGRTHAARNFGVALVALGIVMLVLGIAYEAVFMRELRRRREELVAEGLIHGQSGFPPSMTLVTAVLLFCIGVAAIVSMVVR
jgi:putative membrane protein